MCFLTQAVFICTLLSIVRTHIYTHTHTASHSLAGLGLLQSSCSALIVIYALQPLSRVFTIMVSGSVVVLSNKEKRHKAEIHHCVNVNKIELGTNIIKYNLRFMSTTSWEENSASVFRSVFLHMLIYLSKWPDGEDKPTTRSLNLSANWLLVIVDFPS